MTPIREPSVGTVLSERDDLSRGLAVVRVRMRRSGTAILSASFDPRWTASVDGHTGAVEMVAPALVATSVRGGVHVIVFRYEGYGAYPELFLLSALSVRALVAAERRRRKRRDV